MRHSASRAAAAAATAMALFAPAAAGASSSAPWPDFEPVTGKTGYFSSVGNHRFNIVLPASAAAADAPLAVNVTWRRSDSAPLRKAAFLRTASNAPVGCTYAAADADGATIEFTPTAGETAYYLYYMPFQTCEYANGACMFGAQSSYVPAGAPGACVPSSQQPTSSSRGSRHARSGSGNAKTAAPPALAAAEADVVYQPRAPFQSFEPMEMPMTAVERAEFLTAAAAAAPPAAVVVVAEAHDFPVKMRRGMPARWLARATTAATLTAAVPRGAHFSFQIAVVNAQPVGAGSAAVAGVAFSDLVVAAAGGVNASPAAATAIPASALRCMNSDGVDFWGRNVSWPLPAVPASDGVLPLWVAVVVPDAAPAGVYNGTATVSYSLSRAGDSDGSDAGRGSSNATAAAATAATAATVAISLTVLPGPAVPFGGDDNISTGSRVHWFDSTLGLGDEEPLPSPYTPVVVHTTGAGAERTVTVDLLGKRVVVGASGLPQSIEVVEPTTARPSSSPPPPLSSSSSSSSLGPWPVLAAPLELEVDGLGGGALGPAELEVAPADAQGMAVSWRSQRTASTGEVLTVEASLDCTGYHNFVVTLTASDTAPLDAAGTRLVLRPAAAPFAMGLGRQGGLIDSWLNAGQATARSWLVLDFGANVTLDGLRLYGHGDGVHDVTGHFLQVATPSSVPGTTAQWAAVVGTFGGTTGPGAAGPQDFAFPAATARLWRWVVSDVVASGMCAGAKHCQADVAEVEFHHAGDAPGAFRRNNGTAAASLVLDSSGGETPQNPPWQAVDGNYTYADFVSGWDATERTDLPQPPPAPGPSPPAAATWHWDGHNGNNGVWVGSTKAGARLQLKGADPLWWAGSPYDSGASPPPPAEWDNGGGGGITAHLNGTVVAFTGARALPAGESLTLRFSLLVTPVRPPDRPFQFRARWAQLSGAVNFSALAAASVTVANIHQGNAVNPWINYPYLTNDAMRACANACHALNVSFSVYNTMRELSDRCIEYWPMLAWNRTLVPGDGGGADWLQEHVRGGYLPAWSNPVPPPSTVPGAPAVPDPDPAEGPFLQDAGMRVVALSRWNNYYVAGLAQIRRDYGADGIYLDEIAYDRTTLLRARRVLGAGARVDHHADCGFVSVSPAMNYMELYPFIDRLWYGEGFNYNTESADYWLVEIAAFETGLGADMLRYTSMEHTHGMTRYHYRGLLTGSAFRYSNAGPFDPTEMWALWDAFGITESVMVGWWEAAEHGGNASAVPVRASHPDFFVTSYVRAGATTMVAMAGFGAAGDSEAPAAVRLTFDLAALGFGSGGAAGGGGRGGSAAALQLRVPVVAPFQLAESGNTGVWELGQTFNITASQGGLLLLLEPAAAAAAGSARR